MNLSILFEVLKVVGPAQAALPAFKALYDAGVAMLGNKDQQTAKDAYADLITDNDEGFARFDAKLEAAKRA